MGGDISFDNFDLYVLYCPVMLSHYLHLLGNYARRAIFSEMCKINQSRVVLSIDCLINGKSILTWLVYWIRTVRSVFTGAGLKWLSITGIIQNVSTNSHDVIVCVWVDGIFLCAHSRHYGQYCLAARFCCFLLCSRRQSNTDPHAEMSTRKRSENVEGCCKTFSSSRHQKSSRLVTSPSKIISSRHLVKE